MASSLCLSTSSSPRTLPMASPSIASSPLSSPADAGRFSCCSGCSLASSSGQPPLRSARTNRTTMALRSFNYSSGGVVCMAPEEEKLTRRNPLDFPIEWDRPKPGRRPDIFPQFSPMKTPLPLPLPYDPPEEDEEEEEKKEEEEQEENPDKEEPDAPEKQ